MLALLLICEHTLSMLKSAMDKKEKAYIIARLLRNPNVDVGQLRELSLSPHGYVNDELRRVVWPKLLGLDLDTKMSAHGKSKLLEHRDYNQVVMDVKRSTKRFPPAMKEEHRGKLQDQLTWLIMQVLVNNPQLHYYQGFHDICATFLLILGKNIGYQVVDALSRSHLRDFMDPGMHRTNTMLNYLYPILDRADCELKSYMQKAEVGTIFCLSWLITWYGHALDSARQTVRLCDFFLASHPLMPIYLASAIVLHRREEILETECEMCYIHVLLSNVPTNLPYEELIGLAQQLFHKYPPSELAEEAEFDYYDSKTMKNFAKFEKGIGLHKPLEKRLWKDSKVEAESSQTTLFKVTMWTLTAAVGAAFIAAQYVASSLNS